MSPKPDYLIVIKKSPNKFLESVVIQGDKIKPIIDEISSSKQTDAIKSCPASLEASFDVVVHYNQLGVVDRNFTVFSCPGTQDQSSGSIIEPGVPYETLGTLFKQQYGSS